MYVSLEDNASTGFGRHFFKQEANKGHKIFDAIGLKCVLSIAGSKSKQNYDTRAIEDGWLAANDQSQLYYEENKARLLGNLLLIKDLNDAKVVTAMKFNDILYDFGARYKKGEYDDADQYFDMLEKLGHQKLFFDAIMKRDEFDKMVDA